MTVSCTSTLCEQLHSAPSSCPSYALQAHAHALAALAAPIPKYFYTIAVYHQHRLIDFSDSMDTRLNCFHRCDAESDDKQIVIACSDEFHCVRFLVCTGHGWRVVQVAQRKVRVVYSHAKVRSEVIMKEMV